MKSPGNKKFLFKAILMTIAGTIVTFQIGVTQAEDMHETSAQSYHSKADDNKYRPGFRKRRPDFSGYGQPFSALGEPKNVIVQVRENGDLSKSYFVRSRYFNSTEQISVDGVMTVPPLIARYDFVQVDPDGNVVFIGNYTETPETEDYLNYAAEDAILDPTTFAKTVLNDTWSESWTCNGGGATSTCSWIGSVSGTAVQNNIWVSVYTLLGPGTINGVSFRKLRAETNTYTSGIRYRVRAKGVGEVLRQDSNRPRMLVYYRANGDTGGSLAGTPFASGAPLEGVLF